MPVFTPHPSYTAMLAKWKRCQDCYEGSDAVKAAGTQYLPMLDSHKGSAEGQRRYEEYKLRALFFNATGRTVDGLAGGIFQRAISVEAPEIVLEDTKDITLSSVSLDLFALRTMRAVISPGRFGILVDMAFTPDAKQPVEKRPYWVGYDAADVVGWSVSRAGGDEVLTQVILQETVEEPHEDDPFESECVPQFRQLSLLDGIYTVTLWRQVDGKGDFIPGAPVVPARRGEPLRFIPFVFVNPMSCSATPEKPPLLDLVDVNLSHYRTSADLEHGRHFVALPTPVVFGSILGGGGEGQGPLAIGSGTAWAIEKGGDAKMLEFTGQGLTALEKADSEKRKMMAVLGARLLEEQAGAAETATAVGMRHAGEQATLRTIAQTVEQALSTALQYHAWWQGTEAQPTDVEAEVELNKSVLSVRASSDEVRTALLALQADAISFDTFYARLQAGGWARDGVSAEDELKAIGEQVGGEPMGNADGDAPADQGAAGPQPPVGVAVQDTALNGAQVTSLLEILQSVAAGQLPRETGVQAIVTAFRLSKEEAEQIMGKVGSGFIPAAPTTPARASA